MNMVKKIFLIFVLLIAGCFDVHDNPVQIEMDICEAIESIKSAIKPETPERGEMKPPWTSCVYNEECELGLCMCEICVDPSKFITFGTAE